MTSKSNVFKVFCLSTVLLGASYASIEVREGLVAGAKISKI